MNFSSVSGNKYSINVGMTINHTQAGKDLKKALNEFEKVSVVNVKAKFEGKEAIKQITTYKDALGSLIQTVNYYDTQMKQMRDKKGQFTGTEVKQIKDMSQAFKTLTTETNTYVQSNGKVLTTTTQMLSNGKTITTDTLKYKDAMGQLVTEITKYDDKGKQLGSVQKQISNDTRIVTTEINKYIDAQGREVTETKKLNAQKDGEIQRITRETNAQGQLVTTTEKVLISKGREKKNTAEVTTVIEKDTTATKQNTQAKQQNVQATKNQNGVISDFISTMGKVIKFQVITKIITGFTTACREAVNVVKEFDTALTEFKKVSDLSGDSLDSYTQKLGELGSAVARTRTQMVEASTQFKKSGFSDEDSAQLAQVSS